MQYVQQYQGMCSRHVRTAVDIVRTTVGVVRARTVGTAVAAVGT